MLKEEAVLMIKCPYCGRESNEYNWSLATAARYSIREETCPVLIQVLLATINGEGEFFAGYRLVCPKCYYGVNFEELTLPAEKDIREYAAKAGEDYCQMWL
ncbi:hypothetical protein SAMN02745221_00649 [Thermosyntropha lipolytica DSM 11003]|uniref:Uncharacterized protein n=1 Tax=Thermosyntropha lipolytica DSM 11003 TaxID=1123382 RepID=A0A1M5LEJ9_9FIRM|nr:hypothetical protein [Thermosyntropha lipolytica]SHG63139.1 hypothetical protein SAMN02745221_00649 [Thermosyntropha lipolytica DSM 11003]